FFCFFFVLFWLVWFVWGCGFRVRRFVGVDVCVGWLGFVGGVFAVVLGGLVLFVLFGVLWSLFF
ncbi:hypothetical protein, partial [Yersinia rohdei]|uniref:hypothetical protein n=1 Tax=Yersinia rohdei TaxID=29485 RepID=UPI001C94320A